MSRRIHGIRDAGALVLPPEDPESLDVEVQRAGGVGLIRDANPRQIALNYLPIN